MKERESGLFDSERRRVDSDCHFLRRDARSRARLELPSMGQKQRLPSFATQILSVDYLPLNRTGPCAVASLSF